MKLPADLVNLVTDRGHLRNVEQHLVNKWPRLHQKFLKSKLSFGEFMYRAFDKPQDKCCCGNPTVFVNFITGYKPFCSAKCSANSVSTQTKKRDFYRKTYGVDHQMQVKSIQKQVASTMTERYGAPTTLQSDVLKAKAFATSQAKYGADTFLISKRGYLENLTRQPATQKVREATMLRRYGVKSPLQVKEFHDKQQDSSYELKTLTIKGRSFRVRGREDDVIKTLVNDMSVPIRCIQVSADHLVPTISYRYEGEIKSYFPDIYVVKKRHRILVEAKSDWILGIGRPAVLKQNLAKFRAAECLYEFWLFVYYKRKLVKVKTPGQYSAKELVSLIRHRYSLLKT